MVPDGWERVELGELLDFRNGVNTEAANYGKGSKFVNVMDVFDNRFLTQGLIRGTVSVSPREDASYALQRGDILFNRTSETFDEIALSSVYLDDAHAIFGGFVIRGRPKNGKLLPEFSCYCFSSSAVRREMVRRGQGAIRANIGQSDLAEVPLLVPPLPEQKKIADILSTWDSAIETTEKLLANAETQKRSLMQQLLTGKRRLQGFERSEWQDARLRDVSRVIVSNVDKKSSSNELPVRLCNYTDVYKRDFISPSQEFMRATATADQVRKFRLQVDDVIITKDSETADDIAMPTYVSSTADDLICGYHLAIIRPNERADGRFLKFFFELPHTRHYLGTRANGAIRYGLTVDGIEGARIRLPPIIEQKKIAAILTAAEETIADHRRDIQLLKSAKVALMQQLLTGMRRVVP